MALIGGNKKTVNETTYNQYDQADNSNIVTESGGITARDGSYVVVTDGGAISGALNLADMVSRDSLLTAENIASDSLLTAESLVHENNIFASDITREAIRASESLGLDALSLSRDSVYGALGSVDAIERTTAGALGTVERISLDNNIFAENVTDKALKAAGDAITTIENLSLDNNIFAESVTSRALETAEGALGTLERTTLDTNALISSVSNSAIREVNAATDNAFRYGEVVSSDAFDVTRTALEMADARGADLIEFAKEFSTESVLAAFNQSNTFGQDVIASHERIAKASIDSADMRAADLAGITGQTIDLAFGSNDAARADILAVTTAALERTESATSRALDFIKTTTMPNQAQAEKILEAAKIGALILAAALGIGMVAKAVKG